ncbi:MAG: GGDEF domain [Phormidesmis priestleyi Ana]|uniref:GGDEF domain n=1 Tax=Phormidesmis priestleyi Ana TaxID=1666911 RepID=A0A0P7YPS7_9CYAN|nr:MAG: GGDEF domain [Phormidesmis priestleyi Ana]
MTQPQVYDFESAGRAVLSFLHKRLGFGLWMVTRVQDDDWIVLQSEDHGYGVAPGTVFRWSESFCSEMVRGNGPRFAPNSACVPAYAAAPIGSQVDIGAYIGIPLKNANGDLFGTLCAIDPVPQPQGIAKEQDLVELLAELLSAMLQSDLQAIEARRETERLEVEAQTDSMTGLFNRRAWDQLLAKEEARCRRYGHSSAVLIIDLDGLKHVNDTLGHKAGDEQIVRAATVLRYAVRDVDVVARLGGDEFAIMAVECDQVGAEAIAQRVRKDLENAKVMASVGVAVRKHEDGLSEAVLQADRLMYQEKRRR